MCGHLRRSWCAASRQHYLELQVSLSAPKQGRSFIGDELCRSRHSFRQLPSFETTRCLRPPRAARLSLTQVLLSHASKRVKSMVKTPPSSNLFYEKTSRGAEGARATNRNPKEQRGLGVHGLPSRPCTLFALVSKYKTYFISIE